MLTQELIQELRKPFPANEHKFFGGYPYVDEEAVTDRLDNVDPNWQFEQLEVKRTDIECIVIARLTIHDVSRDGIGMSKLTIKKRDGTTIPAQEPEKGAITDALRRCARLFGIGRYLLLIPKDDDGKSTVTNVKLLGEWLGQSVGNTTQKAQPAAQKPAQQADAKNPFFWFIEGKHPSWFLNPIRDCWQVAKAYIVDPGHGIYKNDIEMKNSFIKRGLLVDNKLVETWGKLRAGEVIYCLFNRDAIDKAGIDWMTIKPEDMAHTISYHAALASEKAS